MLASSRPAMFQLESLQHHYHLLKSNSLLFSIFLAIVVVFRPCLKKFLELEN
jgi:hypothetical protein